jgi:hypothetical protein
VGSCCGPKQRPAGTRRPAGGPPHAGIDADRTHPSRGRCRGFCQVWGNRPLLDGRLATPARQGRGRVGRGAGAPGARGAKKERPVGRARGAGRQRKKAPRGRGAGRWPTPPERPCQPWAAGEGPWSRSIPSVPRTSSLPRGAVSGLPASSGATVGPARAQSSSQRCCEDKSMAFRRGCGAAARRYPGLLQWLQQCATQAGQCSQQRQRGCAPPMACGSGSGERARAECWRGGGGQTDVCRHGSSSINMRLEA